MEKPFPIEITEEDYKKYLEKKTEVVIEGKAVKLNGFSSLKTLQPSDFKEESTTVWSFKERGNWATHKGDYRGNWPPQIPRNLISKFTEEGETVLDPMVGSGTTLVEAKLLGRNAIGVDINYEALILTRDRLNFPEITTIEEVKDVDIDTYHGDARDLSFIENESIDLIATHPPYASIIKYGKKGEPAEGDLSGFRRLDEFVAEVKKVAEECYRVLKPGRYCAILIGDTRKHTHFIPISYPVMSAFLDAGFILKEDVIKVQWNTQTERKWRRFSKNNFLLLMHEHLFIFRKLGPDERLSKFKFSGKWW